VLHCRITVRLGQPVQPDLNRNRVQPFKRHLAKLSEDMTEDVFRRRARVLGRDVASRNGNQRVRVNVSSVIAESGRCICSVDCSMCLASSLYAWNLLSDFGPSTLLRCFLTFWSVSALYW
jgi:hypothetical protein